MPELENLKKDLGKLADLKKVKILRNFFKTGIGEYGEGDIFIGVTVPKSRIVARKYKNLSLKDVKKLLHSKIHEERLVSILLLVEKYKQASDSERNEIVKYYLENAKYVNNWDLVDLSAPKILGIFLLEKKDRSVLYKLCNSDNLWEKRISIISTYEFIRKGQFEDTLKISEILLKDKHDLIQKAVGWMLRELGKRDMKLEETFLVRHHKEIPRTTLRYAIEKFPEAKRKMYLSGNFGI
jgi:3-methyladenine DNA glycosylase AlkD